MTLRRRQGLVASSLGVVMLAMLGIVVGSLVMFEVTGAIDVSGSSFAENVVNTMDSAATSFGISTVLLAVVVGLICIILLAFGMRALGKGMSI